MSGSSSDAASAEPALPGPDRPYADRYATFGPGFFRRFDDPTDLVQQGRVNVTWEFSRQVTVPERRALLEQRVSQQALAPTLDVVQEGK